MTCCCCGPGCYSCSGCCGCSNATCADVTCVGCVSGICAVNAPCTCATPCVPVAGSPAPICCLPLTNPNQDPLLDPLTSPCASGSTDPPPSTSANSVGRSGGSGSGMSASSKGGTVFPRPSQCTNSNILSALLNKLGVVTASAVQGAKNVVAPKKAATLGSVSNMSYIIVVVVVGVLLFMIASGKSSS